MAAYFAKAIIEGRMNYAAVFAVSVYKQFQDATDAILVAEGREDLIVR